MLKEWSRFIRFEKCIGIPDYEMNSSFTVFFFSAESDIATFALIKDHYTAKHHFETNLFAPDTRPIALKVLYDAATKTPVHLMRQLDRWRRDGHRSSRFFLCTPVLGRKGKFKSKVDIEIETRMVSKQKQISSLFISLILSFQHNI